MLPRTKIIVLTADVQGATANTDLPTRLVSAVNSISSFYVIDPLKEKKFVITALTCARAEIQKRQNYTVDVHADTLQPQRDQKTLRIDLSLFG